MQPVLRRRAVAAAFETGQDLGLPVEETVVLNDSNRLVLRLLPCDVVARVAPAPLRVAAELEVLVAGRVGGLEPRVAPAVHERAGFVVTFWTHLPTVGRWEDLSPADYLGALRRLHARLAVTELVVPHVTDRIAETRAWLDDRSLTPDLDDAGRALLAGLLDGLGPSVRDRGATEQVLHGEPHPGNVHVTAAGPVFVDFENSARGPVEYDLGWVPKAVADLHPDADQRLVEVCRGLVLTIIAVHRWRADDAHPSGRHSGIKLLETLRAGPPWPALGSS